jgi:C-terminal processing protease CtpA/Prc
MNKYLKYIYASLLVFALLFVVSCNDEDDITEIGPGPENLDIQDFIWNGMNVFYLWQPRVPDLADDRFSDQEQYEQFLASEPVPEDFFESLIYNRQSVDFWSWIVDDYIELENQFAGISKSNGVDFGLARISSNSNDILGYVRYIMPNSDASGKDIKRGDIFTEVNGTQLTVENYRDLLFSDNDSYTLGMAAIQNGAVIPNGDTVELTKFEYTENPILIVKTFEEAGKKIGYLLYNGFTRGFDDELNAAFLQFKNEGVTDLILDFRYNPGGSVSTAVAMGSMITGQFEGQVFNREQWNPKIQAELEQSQPDWLVNKFSDELPSGESINSLNMNSVHIIVTGNSASASELIISALQPYIDITLVGSQTSGKYTASITLYDSPNFGREGANPDHLYAMQPIVLESVNSLGNNDTNGYEPDIERFEDITDLGILGARNEALLNIAINDIVGGATKFEEFKFPEFEPISNSKLFTPTADNMYVDKPEVRETLSSIRQQNK